MWRDKRKEKMQRKKQKDKSSEKHKPRYGKPMYSYKFSDIDMNFSIEEKNSLHFYQGAESIGHIILSNEKGYLQDFYNVNNAYEVLNTLLYPGLSNEVTRVINENRVLSTVLLDNMEETLKQYENIASAMYKYTYMVNNRSPIETIRFDREDSVRVLKAGANCAFMSATMAPDLDDFHRKNGLVIERIDAPANIEHINMNNVLGWESNLAREEEILFPPFMKLRLEEVELDEKEKEYKDCNGQPPIGKYLLHITNSGIDAIHLLEIERFNKQLEELKQEILLEDNIKNAKYIWSTLKEGRKPCEQQEEKYCNWKDKIQQYVMIVFRMAKGAAQAEKSYLNRYLIFQEDLKKAIMEHNFMREKYSKYIERTGIGVSVFSALVSVCLALSFIDNDIFQIIVKAFGVLSTGVVVSLLGICKSLSWEEKYKQRTTVFLRLDELQRDVKYEVNMNEVVLDQYIKKFSDILKADNMLCEQNVEKAIAHLDILMKKNTNDV